MHSTEIDDVSAARRTVLIINCNLHKILPDVSGTISLCDLQPWLFNNLNVAVLVIKSRQCVVSD